MNIYEICYQLGNAKSEQSIKNLTQKKKNYETKK